MFNRYLSVTVNKSTDEHRDNAPPIELCEILNAD